MKQSDEFITTELATRKKFQQQIRTKDSFHLVVHRSYWVAVHFHGSLEVKKSYHTILRVVENILRVVENIVHSRGHQYGRPLAENPWYPEGIEPEQQLVLPQTEYARDCQDMPRLYALVREHIPMERYSSK
jgi:hypothetical protein